MLQDYRPAVLVGTDQRSPGPSEYLRGKVDSEDQHDGNSHGGNYPQSPKLRSKLTRFWSNNGNIPNGKSFLLVAKFINRCYDFTSIWINNLAYCESIFNLVYTTRTHRVIWKTVSTKKISLLLEKVSKKKQATRFGNTPNNWTSIRPHFGQF